MSREKDSILSIEKVVFFVYRNFFPFFCGTLQKNPPSVAIYLSNRPFHKRHESHLVTVFDPFVKL